ncbi:putative dehydrogenase [Microbacterium terrae]|uniref:Glucose--fructose oxidoreductase n=1 Tax=Microbacterium terrae TaxID=69369 RepID=A0A0M2H0X1_9MICO|nr:Gfo/Idh/MocA family oxidoreductase [Microbacterium terrae]KJL37660.1 Glucose--fructose oxidoreductase precursor [Microbacterium terrae]MBP1076492.1 putative dehydrogenase [Microbacterium terrae]GLJ97321.1 oxidoreductase [Microbacterium terrae]
MSDPLRIGIAGVHGHGRSHVEAALSLGDAVDLAAVADPRGPGEVPSTTRHFADAAAMIADESLDIVVLSTPIPTHAELTIAALGRGSHVLLEKPPVPSVSDHHAVVDAATASARTVQVGFQSLGSDGVQATVDAAASGVIGDVVHYGAVGLWSRSEEYWRRAPWAGHRVLDGRLVADGAVTNPLAHALMTALAIAGAEHPDAVADVDLDLRRANDIAADDTSSLVVTLADGRRIAAGLAVTAPRRHEPYVLVRGTRGHLVYHYTLDLLHVFRDGSALPRTYEFARRGLLADLVAHASTGTPAAVPIARTGAFTGILEAVVSGPEPLPIAASLITRVQHDAEWFRLVDGVGDAVERVAWEGRTFRGLGLL